MFVEVKWSVSFYDVCKNLKQKDNNARAEILKLPTTETLTDDNLIFDACGNVLKQKLSVMHPYFQVESIKLDPHSKLAYISWDIPDTSFVDYLTRLTHSELLELLELDSFVSLPENIHNSNTSEESFLCEVSEYLKSTFEMPFTSFRVVRFKDPSPFRDKFIRADYYTCSAVDIASIEDSLGIDWRDVSDYYISRNVLYIKLNNSHTRLTYEMPKPLLNDSTPHDIEILSN